jgi:hypothetical protein
LSDDQIAVLNGLRFNRSASDGCRWIAKTAVLIDLLIAPLEGEAIPKLRERAEEEECRKKDGGYVLSRRRLASQMKLTGAKG